MHLLHAGRRPSSRVWDNGRVRVLIVEDEPHMAEADPKRPRKEGMAVDIARTGEEAI